MGAVDNSSISPDGPGINDSGFRPDIDGFGFQNYGEHPETVDLTPEEMQRMFGDQVCASMVGGKCILTYPAERWMNQAISAMKFGHCEGIAVLSSLMYYNQTHPNLFGGNSTVDLSLENVLLQREVGYWWITQVTSPGGSKKVLESPQAVLDTLAQAFFEEKGANEWWVMGIYLPDGSGGHAITPFAVEDSGNGTARILVYDNNWPRDSRFIEVDTLSNTWRYQSSINPDEPDSLYSGNASTKNLEIVSLSSRLGQQQCDFCGAESAATDENAEVKNGSKGTLQGAKSIQIWQSGKARALITDENGQRVGLLESGRFVNEIPGAEIRNLKFGPAGMGIAHPPVILLPLALINDSHLAININSTANDSQKNQADTTIIAPGFALSASVPDLGRGLNQSMDLFSEGEAYNVSISANRQLSPTISIDTNYQRITLSGLKIDPSGRINISMDPAFGAFSMSTLGNLKPGTLQLLMTSLDPASGASSTFKSLDLMLRPDDAVSMDLAGSFSEAGSPSLAVSRKNGGRQEMSLQTVSRNVPADISIDLPKDMPRVEDAKNLTRTKLPVSSPLSSGDMSGRGMSIPSSASMPGMGTPTYP
ncbi:MAG: hypothetical protein JW999_01390 [Methanotrichaceae archaeon]|nr:hypothetical protein [Methanotrichaceae archaeon]